MRMQADESGSARIACQHFVVGKILLSSTTEKCECYQKLPQLYRLALRDEIGQNKSNGWGL